jgi:hypothetical protein
VFSVSRSAEQFDAVPCGEPERGGFPGDLALGLEGRALVVGSPVNSVRAGHITLEVLLIAGQRLVFDSSSSELALG